MSKVPDATDTGQTGNPESYGGSWGQRWDSIAQSRFDRSDWIELAATVLLSLATIVAAWSGYQSTRWGGEQAANFNSAGAKRVAATQYQNQHAAQLQIDVITWIAYLEQVQAGSESGQSFLRQRFRKEFRPAFDQWTSQAPEGEVAPGTPFELPQYQPTARRLAEALNAEADALTLAGREANQISDNFVLVAVIMASVLFFAGVGNKIRGHRSRLFMLFMGTVFFAGGTAFMASLPQNIGL
jgi:hypothetical protein